MLTGSFGLLDEMKRIFLGGEGVSRSCSESTLLGTGSSLTKNLKEKRYFFFLCLFVTYLPFVINPRFGRGQKSPPPPFPHPGCSSRDFSSSASFSFQGGRNKTKGKGGGREGRTRNERGFPHKSSPPSLPKRRERERLRHFPSPPSCHACVLRWFVWLPGLKENCATYSVLSYRPRE